MQSMAMSVRRQYKREDVFSKNQSQTTSLQIFLLQQTIAKTMQPIFRKSVTLFCAVMILVCAIISTTDATYRKPPFNGSIFGKRTGNNNEYDSASKALSAMCEIASEACQTWFPITQEK